jgi:peptidoglycan hydrolase-like amidase
MSWDGASLPSAVWVQPAESGYVAVGDRWYRGRLLLVNQGSGVYAINYVLLRDYLYGVVGTEVSSSWPIEAIRAQAVAARSYALTHNVRPASDLYDLDDTQRYQAYSGLSREASSIYEAVDSTSGEFISYQGGIVESLYAASDDIVQSVHGGLGMSQLGALEFAKQGYSYDQILAYYYPETAIARLDVGPD